jgi:CPA1 family monovalent cation:H+ antiporter
MLSVSGLVFWMILAITIFAVVSRLIRIPYPIVMLVGGGLVGLIPDGQMISLPPDVVFLVLLPLLLFVGGWTTDLRLFRQFLVPILWLALGLVVLTTVIVAFVAHAWFGLPLASAFVLGAILSPSDAIATEAIAEEIEFPPGSETILSGESLVNDAAALVIYGFAVGAATTGTFSLAPVALDFVYVSVAGIGIGVAVAWGMDRIVSAMHKAKLSDELLGVLISVVTPFLTYLPAQAAQASGVLAAVSGGVFLSSRSGSIFTAQQRIAVASFWVVITFALNGFAFILIGLQLRSVFGQLTMFRPEMLVVYAFGIAALVVAIRFAAVFPGGYLRWRRLRALGRTDDATPRWGEFLVTSWSGMRGIVTLAGALAIPSTTASGQPFPGRALILFLAFTTIVITLIGQGLTLPTIVKRFTKPRDDTFERDLALAQLRLATAGRERLRELEMGFTTTEEWEVATRLIGMLDQRFAKARAFLDGASDEVTRAVDVTAIDRDLLLEMCEAERTELEAMRKRGEISDRAYRQTEYGIDLAESLFRQGSPTPGATG